VPVAASVLAVVTLPSLRLVIVTLDPPKAGSSLSRW
jgi:hypothetical protein